MGVPSPEGVSASGRGPYWPNDKANGVIQGTIGAVRATAPFAFWGPMNLFVWADFTTSAAVTAGSLVVALGAAGVIAAGASISATNLPYGTTVVSLAGTDATVALPIQTHTAKVLSGQVLMTDLYSTQYLLGATVTGPGIPAATTVAEIVTVARASSGDTPGIRGVVRLSNAVTLNPPNTNNQPFQFALAATGLATANDAAAKITSAAIGMVGAIQLERSFDGGATWIVCNVGNVGALAQWNTATPVSISFGEPERMVLYRLNQTTITPSAGYTLNYRISETGQAATTLAVPTI
jgi:hypothetical protein